MITEIIENQQNFLKKELVKHFNEEAKKLNLKFKMDYTSGRLVLQKKGWNLAGWDVFYNTIDNTFKVELIDTKNFEKVKPILEAIPEQFIVEIVKEGIQKPSEDDVMMLRRN